MICSQDYISQIFLDQPVHNTSFYFPSNTYAPFHAHLLLLIRVGNMVVIEKKNQTEYNDLI